MKKGGLFIESIGKWVRAESEKILRGGRKLRRWDGCAEGWERG